MDIDIKDIITLSDDNDYVVVGKANYQDNIYYYLIDKNNNENIKFCIENRVKSTLTEVEDNNLIKCLLPIFLNSTLNSITKEDLELIGE